jgi:hypothetical protein
MKLKHIRDQRGVAMIFELVLIAAVLVLAGLAVYQAAGRSKTASNASVEAPKPTPSSAAGLAASAAATTIQDSAADASLSATAEAATDEVSATDTDISNLGGSSADSF